MLILKYLLLIALLIWQKQDSYLPTHLRIKSIYFTLIVKLFMHVQHTD